MRKPPSPVLALLVLLAGCGGGGDGGGKKKPAVTVDGREPIAFSADEYSFEPSNVVAQTGSKGAAVVRFELSNDGSLAHDLHVRKGADDLGGTPIFGPGKTDSGQATLAPGKYELICTVGDHAELGMKGTLTVEAGP